jgi:hypothetical protein
LLRPARIQIRSNTIRTDFNVPSVGLYQGLAP